MRPAVLFDGDLRRIYRQRVKSIGGRSLGGSVGGVG